MQRRGVALPGSALMNDIGRQQALWDVIEEFDGKLQHRTRLVEKLTKDPPRNEIRASDTSPSQPQFLRLKEVMPRVGLRVNTIYRYVARAAFPAPRRFGRSSFWVTEATRRHKEVTTAMMA